MRWQSFAACAAVVVGACHAGGRPRPVTAMSPAAAASSSIAPPAARHDTIEQASACADDDAIPVWEDGVERGRVCREAAGERGLTVVDLSDDWTPRVLARTADGVTPEYHPTYVAIANEQLPDDAEVADALAELYGVTPALSVVRARLADDERHACWSAIDPAPIAALTRAWSMSDKARVHAADARRRSLAKRLEAARKKHELPDLASVSAVPGYAKLVAKWQDLDALHAGLVAAQRRLDCEGVLIKEKVEGEFTWRTGNAVELFQRRHFLMPNERLDAETREAMGRDSRELDFRLALRILRERVVDASGLLEDGSAADGPVPVLGRMLDPENMQQARGHEPLPDAAGDLVHPATEAAARALGWTDAAAVERFLDEHHGGYEVAIALPARPAYHGEHMELEAVLDRGDVWYDERPIRHTAKRRPTLILYAKDGDVRRPLVRWPSTIGGWADVRLPSGTVRQKWKESDVGKRVWKELYAGPTWTPPPTTPDRDLVRNLWNGRYRLKTEIFGPGAHSAYGLVMLIHHKERKKDGVIFDYDDNGIRTHGSSTVTSIVNGTSHGCHRLYNQLAVRLGGFLLHHRRYLVRGEQTIGYRRRVRYKGDYEARVDTKGFMYELTPPVPVDVLEGKILSKRKKPPVNSAPARP
jgi:lipoprotein-anchoring transpeptidase ErfK/SrfK